MSTFNNNKETEKIEIGYPHNNLRTITVLEELVENLDKIPIEELVNKHKL